MPRVLSLLLTVVAGLALLKVLVIWLEPRMAFFPFRGVQDTPASAGVSYSDETLTTGDGERLHAWWIAHHDPRGQVIFWHGNGGNLSLWLDLILELNSRRFAVLAVDYRGYGASTGRPSEQGIYRDADAAVAEFHRRLRLPDLPVIYWGRSLGSTVAAYSATRQRPDALVLESPMPDVSAVLRTSPVLWLLGLFSSYRFPTSQFLAAYDGPLLVVHGDADSIIPFSAGRRVFEEAPTAHKVFLPLPGTDHNDPYFSTSAPYWAAVDDFLAAVSTHDAGSEPGHSLR